jgi:hypothetical protein
VLALRGLQAGLSDRRPADHVPAFDAWNLNSLVAFFPDKGPGYIIATIKVIDQLPISAAEKQLIYEGNARRLLKI